MEKWAKEAEENSGTCENCGKPLLTAMNGQLYLGHFCDTEEHVDVTYEEKKRKVHVTRQPHKPLEYVWIEGELKL